MSEHASDAGGTAENAVADAQTAGNIPPAKPKHVTLAVVVAALGYFVDIFDLLLFAIVRIPSLRDLGVAADQVKAVGIRLDNYIQTTGLMVGGIFWGIVADRRGRLSVLFGSILCYSLANLLNAFITDIGPDSSFAFLRSIGLGTALAQYEVLRFAAGFGLAGELGAGVTLVAELMHKESRGIGTTIVASVGVLGAVAAAIVGEYMHWRNAYLLGGALGLALLFLRVGVVESGLFESARGTHVEGRGAFWKLFHPWSRFRRYAAIIGLGLPIWYAVGVLVKYIPELGASLGIPPEELPTPGKAILWCYIGLAVGDLASGLVSQWMRSRRGAVLLFHGMTALAIAGYFFLLPRSLATTNLLLLLLGISIGYWAVFVTMAAEQFGTNLRGTAATTAPNFVRWIGAAGSAFLWQWFESFGVLNRWQSAALVGAIVLVIAVASVLSLRESFSRSLEYHET
jgi:MFS family permease